MFEFVFGLIVGSLIWRVRVKALEKQLKETTDAAENTKVAALLLQLEYRQFRNQYDDYRKRFDPIDITTENNVTYLRKKPDVRQ